MDSMQHFMTNARARRLASGLLAGALWLGLGTACTFDETTLEDIRCSNDAACLEKLGPGFACNTEEGDPEGGYCQSSGGRCDADADCDDGVFCTVETCDKASPDATAFGCVITARDVDDGIACTQDACDESAGAVVNDASSCDCTDTNDPRCNDSDPCTEDTCDTDTLSCSNVPLNAGDDCDDGISCTVNTACDNDGLCVGDGNDLVCDDGQFCNGPEVCDPTDNSAGVDGCAPGTPLAQTEDDGVACTDTVCDEGTQSISHAPTDACACIEDIDCRPASPAEGCGIFTCGDDFSCAPESPIDFDTDGPCDDGVECTIADTCQGDGTCRGRPIDDLCDEGEVCDPNSGCL